MGVCPNKVKDKDDEDRTGVSHCIVCKSHEEHAMSLTLKDTKGHVNEDWILLDSQSTHCIFKNAKLLTNICHCGHTGLTMYSNGGS